jgi:hypothetical protein
MRKYIPVFVVLAALATIVAPLQATILVPGAAPVAPTRLSGLDAGSLVTNGGTANVYGFTGYDTTGHIAIIATLYFAVYQEAATGYLDFLYQIQIAKPKSQDAVLKQLNASFGQAGFVDADFLSWLNRPSCLRVF